MNKSDVIRELRAKKSLWERVALLTEERKQAELEKTSALEKKAKKDKESYPYVFERGSKLSVDNAERVRLHINERRRIAAKKAIKSARIAVLISIVVSFVTMLCFVKIEKNHTTDLIETCCAISFVFGFTGWWMFLGVRSKASELLPDVTKPSMTTIKKVIIVWVLIQGWLVTILLVLFLGAAQHNVEIDESNIIQDIPKWIPYAFGPHLLAFFAALIPLVCLKLHTLTIVKKFSSPTAEELARLEEAKAEDEKNAAANEAACEKANAEAEREFENRKRSEKESLDNQVQRCKEKIARLNQEISELTRQAQSEILSPKDNNIKVITWLLDDLETGRADTLKEALHMADVKLDVEEQKRIQQQEIQAYYENKLYVDRWAREMAKLERDRQWQEQRDREWRIQRHNEKMEEETYKMRRALEDRQNK